MPTITIAGETLSFAHHRGTLRPTGVPLLLLHGAGGNLMHWPGDLRRLRDHEVYALDLPGHGRSSGSGRTDIGAYAEVVREFADALGLSAFVLCGHSMGGAIALECALRYADRLAGLILVGTGARLPVTPQIVQGILSEFATTTSLLADLAHGEHVDANLHRIYRRNLREMAPPIIHGDFLACDAFDRQADLAAITAPTLIICGAADRMTPVRYSQFLAEQIQGAHLLIVPAAGHMVMLEPEGLPVAVNAIREFLERCG